MGVPGYKVSTQPLLWSDTPPHGTPANTAGQIAPPPPAYQPALPADQESTHAAGQGTPVQSEVNTAWSTGQIALLVIVLALSVIMGAVGIYYCTKKPTEAGESEKY